MNESTENRSTEEILRDLVKAFSSFKQKMEDPNYIALDQSIKAMMENQRDMKTDVKDLKKKLLNPFDGVIVNTNKNTEFRKNYEALENERAKLEDDVNALIKWKSTYLKVFWALFTAALGIITFLIGESIINQ
tara:strand:- start:295 stop:693 length:399 start_codon:yes stop_codon:yes gene_type:complete